MQDKFLLVLFLFLFHSPNIFAGDQLPSLLVSNTWKMVDTSRGTLADIFLKKCKIKFFPNGEWSFQIELDGKNTGKRRNGTGTWGVKEQTLVYTVGDISGQSHIEIIDGILQLKPDPIVGLNGNESVSGIYIKD